MILLAGIRSEPPLALVAGELERLGAPVVWFDQRQAAETALTFELTAGRLRGSFLLGLDAVPLNEIRAVYLRAMDDRLLPELAGLRPDAPARLRSRELHDGLMAWVGLAPALVVNRPAAQASNASKPYQAQLIAAAGFATPETLVTNDPDDVLEFRARHGRIVYKSLSGARSIVEVLTDADVRRLDEIRWCPVQFQAYVEGTDVRVHTIGGEAFAARVTSWATDYRYPDRTGSPAAAIEPFDLPADLGERCIRLAGRLGLELAGIDLRIRPDGEAVCFEVNPSPAYSYYEQGAGLPIAAAIARRLAAA